MQELYPGGKVIAESDAARMWSDQMGMDFHEIQIKGNAHVLTLICADLDVTEVPAGHASFATT